jgi:hypothetical protein
VLEVAVEAMAEVVLEQLSVLRQLQQFIFLLIKQSQSVQVVLVEVLVALDAQRHHI